MRDIQPFMVADGLADFSREKHLRALRYTAKCCGQVVTTAYLLPGIVSKEALRQQILTLLDEIPADTAVYSTIFWLTVGANRAGSTT